MSTDAPPAADYEFSTTAETIRMLCELLFEKGVTEQALARRTGIDPANLPVPDAVFSVGAFVRLWQLAVEVTGDRAIALRLRSYFPGERTHFLVRISMYSRSLMEAARHWVTYNNMINGAVRFDILEQDREVIIRFVNLSARHGCVWFSEYDFSMAIHIARRLTNTPVSPVAVRFEHPDPGYADVYESVFNSPVLFSQGDTELVMKKEDMERRSVTHDPYLQSVIQKIAENRAVSTGFQGTGDSLVFHLKACLARGDARLEAVAGEMNMSKGRLCRRLKSQGTSFTRVLESTRKDLATDYLRQGLDSSQIAYLIGFSSPSSFHHAFRRWFGMPIRDYVSQFTD